MPTIRINEIKILPLPVFEVTFVLERLLVVNVSEWEGTTFGVFLTRGIVSAAVEET